MIAHRTFVSSSIVFVALSCILYWLVPTNQAHFDHDSWAYDRMGFYFQQHHTIADPQDVENAPIQTVGYPLFLGLIYMIAGHSYGAVVCMQIICALICLWFVMRIAGRFFSPTVASLAVALCAGTIGMLVYPQLLLAEIPLMLFLFACLDRLTAYLIKPTYAAVAQAGMLLGVSIILKPVGLLFGCLVPLVLIAWRRNWMPAMLFLSCFLIPVLGYMGYNCWRYKSMSLAPMMELNLYQCFLSKVIARAEGGKAATIAQTTLAFEAENNFDQSGWADARTLFFHYVRKYPFLCIQVWMENVAKTLFGLYTTQAKRMFEPGLDGNDCSFFVTHGTLIDRAYAYCIAGTEQVWLRMLAIFEAVWSLLRWLLVCYAVVIGWRMGQKRIITLLSLYCMCCAVVTGMDGCCRYRIVFEPIMLIGAAAGIALVWARWSGRNHVDYVIKECA